MASEDRIYWTVMESDWYPLSEKDKAFLSENGLEMKTMMTHVTSLPFEVRYVCIAATDPFCALFKVRFPEGQWTTGE